MIAIHHRVGSFSEKWIQYCDSNKIQYKIVNCYSNNIISDLEGCNVLLWHWVHGDYKAVIFARQLIASLEMKGLRIFPNIKTCWHFDDKVGQKYLLESIGAPLVPSYVFYDKQKALDWAVSTTYPKVFKLRSGAGAMNVQMLHDVRDAKYIIKKMFSSGLKYYSGYLWKERLWHFKRDRDLRSFLNLSKGLGRVFIRTDEEKFLPKNVHYVYFQEFISGNNFDYRVMVLGGNRAFCFKRFVRDGDFRASGSGKSLFQKDDVPIDMLEISYSIAKKLALQSVAIDYVFQSGKPLIVEMSYAFGNKAFPIWPGYWDENLEWIEEAVAPEDIIIEQMLYCVQ